MNRDLGLAILITFCTMLALTARNAHGQPAPSHNCQPAQGAVSVTCDLRVRTDGSNPDATTAGIQSIINRHDRVVFPPGLYTIACRNKKNRDCHDGTRIPTDTAVQIPAGKHVHLMPGARLQAEVAPGAAGVQIMFRLMGDGPVLSGDSGSVIDMRRSRQPRNHCQFGIWIGGPWAETVGTSKAAVTGPISIKNASGRANGTCGDGIYIGGGKSSPEEVRVTGADIDGNWRQAISVTSGRSIRIEGSTLRRTAGRKPGCGIDLEPNRRKTVKAVRIVANLIEDNAGCGVAIAAQVGQVSGVDIIGNVIKRNGPKGALLIQGQASAIRFAGNNISTDRGFWAHVYAIRDIPTERPIEIRENLFIREGSGGARACVQIDEPFGGLATSRVRVERNVFSGCDREAVALDLRSPRYAGNLEDIVIQRNLMWNSARRGRAAIGILHNGSANTARKITVRENTMLENRARGRRADSAVHAASTIPSVDKATWDVRDNLMDGIWDKVYDGITPANPNTGHRKKNSQAFALAGDGSLAPQCSTGSVCVVEVSCARSNCNANLASIPAAMALPVYLVNTGAANNVTLAQVAGRVMLKGGTNLVLAPGEAVLLAFMGHQNQWVQFAPKSSRRMSLR